LERNPTLTPDGLTIYFESDRSGESSDIYVADRNQLSAQFGAARLAQPVSTKRNDVPGAVSAFTNTFYFSADRLGGPGLENIYQAERQGGDAFAETFLISSIDSDDSNVAPAPSSDELTLYFSSNRDSPDLKYDVYRARREARGGLYGLPLKVPELSSSASDMVAWLSSDECRILLTRETPLGSGHVALLTAVR
jgi:Tol biopolymer transport system component